MLGQFCGFKIPSQRVLETLVSPGVVGEPVYSFALSFLEQQKVPLLLPDPLSDVIVLTTLLYDPESLNQGESDIQTRGRFNIVCTNKNLLIHLYSCDLTVVRTTH